MFFTLLCGYSFKNKYRSMTTMAPNTGLEPAVAFTIISFQG